MDGEVLPTLEGGNLTVFTETVNGAEQITIISPGSEGTIITPPQYACHVSLAAATALHCVLLHAHVHLCYHKLLCLLPVLSQFTC